MIYIIIPVFNRWHYTKACLESLQNQTCTHFKIIVVDHGSEDDTSANLANNYPEVTVINGDRSMWWTAATNLGIKYALEQGASYILTLNNDTIANEDYIHQLIVSSKNAKQDSIIGSSAIDAVTKKIIYRGERLLWFNESSIFNTDTFFVKPLSGLLDVTHFPGRGLLIPKNVFIKIGLFDEHYYPHYMADYDFTLKAVKNGFDIYCSWDAMIATYPEASGANLLKIKKTFKGYKEHLFGIKGGGNLILFYRYVFRHCPLYAMPTHLLLGTARRVFGYWLK